jgi:hypothetical protein
VRAVESEERVQIASRHWAHRRAAARRMLLGVRLMILPQILEYSALNDNGVPTEK